MITPITIFPIKSTNFLGTKNICEERTVSDKEISDLLETPQGLYIQKEINAKTIETKQRFRNFINKSGKVTFEEYLDILENHPEILMEAKSYISSTRKSKFDYTTPKIAAMASLVCKKRLDSLYGEDKYRLVSIGTSPSFITESMKEMGVDTVFLPISNASYIDQNLSLEECFDKYPNLKNCSDYLKSKGINPEDIGDKKIVLLDFYNRGKTLSLVKRLVEEDCNVPKTKVFKLRLADLISGARSNVPKNLKGVISFNPEDILDEVDAQKVDCMSNTPHYSVYGERYNMKCPFSIETGFKSQEHLFDEFDKFSKPSARAYQLLVLHELDKLTRGGLC